MKIRDIIGDKMEEDFLEFDYTYIQETLNEVSNSATPNLAMAEYLQFKCLSAADVLIEYSGKLIKYSTYLDNKITSMRNRHAMEFYAANPKAAADIRAMSLKSCPDADELENTSAQLKGTRAIIEKKFDLLIKAHHHYKEVASRLNRMIPSENGRPGSEKGYERQDFDGGWSVGS